MNNDSATRYDRLNEPRPPAFWEMFLEGIMFVIALILVLTYILLWSA